MRLVVYPIIFKVLAPFQVVSRISAINSIPPDGKAGKSSTQKCRLEWDICDRSLEREQTTPFFFGGKKNWENWDHDLRLKEQH